MTYQFEISVFVTCFNKRPFIRAALQSLVDQKEAPHFELIILDDASTDGSWEEIQSFVTNRRNPTIKTFRNEKNEGLAAGMKQGISLASGKYFCRFDGDDFWYPNALQTLYFACPSP